MGRLSCVKTNRISWTLFFGFVVLVTMATNALADEVRLANGDRLTGEILTMEAESLTLKTTYAGDIKLNWQDVVCVTSDRDLTFRLKNKEVFMGRATCPGEGRIQVVGVTIGESGDLSLDQLEAINPSPPPPAITYTGNFTAGANGSSGNTDEVAAYFSAGFIARSKRHRLTLAGKYNYGETDNEITTRNALGSIKYDFFFTDRLYSYAHGLFENDEFQDLNLRSTTGLGLGYQVFDTERTSLFIEGGVSYLNEDFDVARDNHYTSGRESLGFTFDILPERVRFFHLHELYISLEESDEYYFRADQGLRFTLFKNFFASFEVDYSYNRQPAPGKKSADTRYIAGLGYAFEF